MAFAEINDARFYYESHGKGHPIILIAGYTCDHTAWDKVTELLARHFQVIVFDNRGVGQTKDAQAPLTIELMAHDVIMLADQLNLKRPHIIGQSMGGNIAQVIAGQHSEKIGKVCILTSSPKWRDAMLLGFKSLLSMRENDEPFDRQFDAGIPWLFGDVFLNSKEDLLAFKNGILNNPYPQSLEDQQRQFKAIHLYNGKPYLAAIRSHALIAYGSQDIVALPSEAMQLANTIQNSSLVEFNCGHGILLEVPQKLSGTLIDFLTH